MSHCKIEDRHGTIVTCHHSKVRTEHRVQLGNGYAHCEGNPLQAEHEKPPRQGAPCDTGESLQQQYLHLKPREQQVPGSREGEEATLMLRAHDTAWGGGRGSCHSSWTTLHSLSLGPVQSKDRTG